MTNPTPKDQGMEALIEEARNETDWIEFLHGVPVKLPKEKAAALEKLVRKAHTLGKQERGREIREAVEGVMRNLIDWNSPKRLAEGKTMDDVREAFLKLLTDNETDV